MENLLSGLIGAILGGAISYFGSKAATEKQIKNQNELFNAQLAKQDQNRDLENKSRATKAAALLCVEMINWILSSIRYYNDITRKDNKFKSLEFNSDYRKYLQEIMNQLEFEEIEKIIQFYGLTEMIHNNLMTNSDSTGNSDSRITGSYHLLMRMCFDDEKITYYNTIDPNEISKSKIIQDLLPPFRELLIHLQSISGKDIKIFSN